MDRFDYIEICVLKFFGWANNTERILIKMQLSKDKWWIGKNIHKTFNRHYEVTWEVQSTLQKNRQRIKTEEKRYAVFPAFASIIYVILKCVRAHIRAHTQRPVSPEWNSSREFAQTELTLTWEINQLLCNLRAISV